MKIPLPRSRRSFLLALLSWSSLASGAAAPAKSAVVVTEVRKIWDQGQHNAFTDLVQWRGRWWCTFRESAGHVGGDGNIRVLESADGDKWTSAALIAEKDIDLRDPKFSITPKDQLMINCGGSVYLGTSQLKGRRSRVMFSNDGRTWTPPARVLGEGEWLWRVTWHQGIAYGAAYDHTAGRTGGTAAPEWWLKLYSSRDGLAWTLVTPLDVKGQPNETTLRFLPGGEMIAMVRREAGTTNGMIGRASPPYRRWTWQESNFRFGGPNFMRTPAGAWIASTRDYSESQPRSTKGRTTMIARMELNGPLTPIATLPSGGDNSYAGMAWHEDRLWLSYYSSHEGKSAIYLAKIKMN